MALRLTGISTPADSSGTPAGVGLQTFAATESGGAFGNRLGTQARVHLSANDLDGYKKLFARAGEHTDPQARYHARVRLVEEGLAAAGQSTSETQATQRYAAVAAGAITALEQEPREPVLLIYAGVALYELWSLEAAHAMFKAAHGLDPALPHLKRNLDELAKRRREASQSGRSLRPLHAQVPALASKARAIAKRARPTTGLTLSLCMIVKDEEEMLPRCLGAVAPAVDEIVIVDTGSTDRTIEIARAHGAKVIEREWTGSFSDARNVSFEAATGDWIIYLDADEVLVPEDVNRLRKLTGRTWREAFYLVETSYTGELGDGAAITNNALRVFRNRPQYRFEGRLHEQIAHNLPVYAAGRLEQSSVRIEHYGYLGAVRDAKEKSRRNLDLLKAQQAESPSDAFLHFNLGTEYTVLGDHGSALTEYEQAWGLVQSQGQEDRDFVPALLQRLVTALRYCRHARRRRDRPERSTALERSSRASPTSVYSQGARARPCARPRGRRDRLLAALHRDGRRAGAVRGVGRRRYLHPPDLAGRAVCAPRRARGREGAARLVRQRAPRRDRRDRSVCVGDAEERHARRADRDRNRGAGPQPDAIGPVRARDHVLRPGRDGRGRRSVPRRRDRPPAQHAGPRAARRSAPQRAPLHRGRHRGGGDCRRRCVRRAGLPDRALGPDRGWRPRTGANAATARAVNAGVPKAERETFAGWLEIASGTPEQELRRLPVAATPLLGVILETLLAAHDFDTFESLTKLLGRSALVQREQRELLAGMYLKYGFLQSAAQEWMAACADPP